MTGERDKDRERRERENALFPFSPFAKMTAKLRRAFRGDVTAREAALELSRRARVALTLRRERRELALTRGALAPARLAPEYARLTPPELLAHFRSHERTRSLPGIEEMARTERPETILSPSALDRAVERAVEILEGRRWPLLGFGAFEFGPRPDWLRDPASGLSWPLDYHGDLTLARFDGSDVRVLWELNRLGHVVALAQGYAATRDGRFASEALRQVREWREANPRGFGPNWACAMEVALRAMNLLVAFRLISGAREFDDDSLAFMLALFDEHGRHISRHLEFSHIATSNHYLTDVAGLFWLGASLPELALAREWREWAWRELLEEMDAQVYDEGADVEASTGYQRFVAELFLYSFTLARAVGIEPDARRLARLRAMLEYVRACLRPDGRAPLVGDSDGGLALHLNERASDEHAHLLSIGAAVFDEPRLCVESEAPPELFWTLGAEGVRRFESLAASEFTSEHASASTGEITNATGRAASDLVAEETNESTTFENESPASEKESPTFENESRAFERAGTYVLRAGDLYLLLSACGAGLKGRGSHAHNDALSVEVSAHGASFIRDPGTYLYTADPRERQLFRSTRYHSTVEVDGAEQSTIDESRPFIIGDEARPRLVRWESDAERDIVVAEHNGYARLKAGAVVHRRAVLFDKRARLWLVEDALTGDGTHRFDFRFHFASGLDVRARADGIVEACATMNGTRLYIVPLGSPRLEADIERLEADIEHLWSSSDYGAKRPSKAARWTIEGSAPLVARWALLPARDDETEAERLAALERANRNPPDL